MDKKLVALLQPREGCRLTGYEAKYFKVGFWLMLIGGPIQMFLAFRTLANADTDYITFYPLLWLFGYIIASGLIHTIIMLLLTGNYATAKEMNDSLGITKIGIFAFHAGISMMCRIIWVYLHRGTDPEYRLNYPHIITWED